jgi:hypothetical protein
VPVSRPLFPDILAGNIAERESKSVYAGLFLEANGVKIIYTLVPRGD